MSKDKVNLKDLRESDYMVWSPINETTRTYSSGEFPLPFSSKKNKWNKTSLGPFTEEMYDEDYEEHTDPNINNESKINESKIVEDLAVWFGTKKKPKGSKQPKGPWVNICRKKEGGGHPPCGRDNADKGSYPKCRAVHVASKMTDSEKKAACSQKRKAEKKDTQTGKGQKPVYTSYKPKKKKTKKESLILKKVLMEKFKVGADEYDKIYEDDKFLLVIPYTHEASCKYGAGTKWCTTGRDEKGEEWFNKHFDSGSLGYFIIKDRELAQRLGTTKYGVYVNRPDKNYLSGRYMAPSGIIIYDDKNDGIHPTKMGNIFDRENLYGKLAIILNKFLDYSKEKFESMDNIEDSNVDK